jgi:hypothetical protein
VGHGSLLGEHRSLRSPPNVGAFQEPKKEAVKYGRSLPRSCTAKHPLLRTGSSREEIAVAPPERNMGWNAIVI